MKKIGVVAATVVSAGIMVASPAAAAQQCGNLGGPAGGSLPLCKSWNWDGNDYDGKWWTNGPSSLPSQTYLQRSEAGVVKNSAYSGSYQDVSRRSISGSATGSPTAATVGGKRRGGRIWPCWAALNELEWMCDRRTV
ncbi:hypothetical protein LWC34_15575 [Kibdelosporangium philippinense]|uniref:Peptidase inhibitor family I36 n=1 Tax=Kibdelosporangium philippinense TaxID=211113 RepID=A0ABS8Z8P0_9PSEU|nr:hypothetical protein [Kibdelosporangium philippinense]MCE7004244.1 hypothetical protein [Kibdelosporangium philippinense]